MLKTWAKKQADEGIIPTVEQCAAEVKRISAHFVGPGRPLKPEVVDFYTTEVAEMVKKLLGEGDVETAIDCAHK